MERRSSLLASEETLRAGGLVSSYRLPKTIPAIQVYCVHEGSPELGAISHLPEGAELTFCGGGFNDATVKARCGGQFYFVFLEDLESASPSAHGEDSESTTSFAPRKASKSQGSRVRTASHVA